MAKSKFDKSVLSHIADLARIKLSPAEITTYSQQIERVIDHIDRITKVDTKNTDPTYQVINTKNVFNQNKTNHLPVKLAISTARSTYKDFIVVPASIEK